MPDPQPDAVLPEIAYNANFASIAKSLKPTLSSWIDHPLSVISFEPVPVNSSSNWFGYKSDHRYTIPQLADIKWSKGGEFILDFGGHRVGYFSFHIDAIGANIDAPARLRLTF